MWSLLYLVARALVRLLVGRGQQGQDGGGKDLEILALRHQLRVLQRTSGRPKLHVIDRVLLAAASRVIPRERWVTFWFSLSLTALYAMGVIDWTADGHLERRIVPA